MADSLSARDLLERFAGAVLRAAGVRVGSSGDVAASVAAVAPGWCQALSADDRESIHRAACDLDDGRRSVLVNSLCDSIGVSPARGAGWCDALEGLLDGLRAVSPDTEAGELASAIAAKLGVPGGESTAASRVENSLLGSLVSSAILHSQLTVASSQPAASGPLPEVAGYRIHRLIGEGAFARVYLATDPDGRRCALKIGRLHEPQRVAREVAAMKRLDHPNLVRYLDSGTIAADESVDNDYFWIAMEHAGDLTLADAMAGPVRPDTAQVFDIVGQIIEGLAELHRQGIVHRDLKPANVLIGYDFTVRLADFGLARILDPDHTAATATVAHTATGQLLGTPRYMAPEQVEGDKDITPATDIWALGVITWELFTGGPLFDAKNAMALGRDIFTKPIAIDDTSGIPAAANEILARCLRREKATRFASAQELASEWRSANDDATAWAKATTTDDLGAYQQYLKRVHRRPRAYLARAQEAISRLERASDKQDWRRAQKQDTQEAYEHYLSAPDPRIFDDEARQRMAELRHADAQATNREAERFDTAAASRAFLTQDPSSPGTAQAHEHAEARSSSWWRSSWRAFLAADSHWAWHGLNVGCLHILIWGCAGCGIVILAMIIVLSLLFAS